MPDDPLKAALEQTAWYLAQSQKIIANQLAVIVSLRAAGAPGVAVDEMLAVFIRMLEALGGFERLLREEIEQRGGSGGKD